MTYASYTIVTRFITLTPLGWVCEGLPDGGTPLAASDWQVAVTTLSHDAWEHPSHAERPELGLGQSELVAYGAETHRHECGPNEAHWLLDAALAMAPLVGCSAEEATSLFHQGVAYGVPGRWDAAVAALTPLLSESHPVGTRITMSAMADIVVATIG